MKFSEMRQSTIFQCDKCHFICTGFGFQKTEIYFLILKEDHILNQN